MKQNYFWKGFFFYIKKWKALLTRYPESLASIIPKLRMVCIQNVASHGKWILWIVPPRLLKKFLLLLSSFPLSTCLFAHLPSTLIKHLLCLRCELEAGVEGKGETFKQLTCMPLKVRHLTNSVSLAGLRKPLVCWLLCQNSPFLLPHPRIAFPLFSPDSVLSQALMPKGRGPEEEDSCPKILGAPPLRIPQQPGQGRTKCAEQLLQ